MLLFPCLFCPENNLPSSPLFSASIILLPFFLLPSFSTTLTFSSFFFFSPGVFFFWNLGFYAFRRREGKGKKRRERKGEMGKKKRKNGKRGGKEEKERGKWGGQKRREKERETNHRPPLPLALTFPFIALPDLSFAASCWP